MTKQLNRQDAVSRLEDVLHFIDGDDTESRLLTAAICLIQSAVLAGDLTGLSRFLYPYSQELRDRANNLIASVTAAGKGQRQP